MPENTDNKDNINKTLNDSKSHVSPDNESQNTSSTVNSDLTAEESAGITKTDTVSGNPEILNTNNLNEEITADSSKNTREFDKQEKLYDKENSAPILPIEKKVREKKVREKKVIEKKVIEKKIIEKKVRENKVKEEKVKEEKKESKESNYQISLINERNLLIKVVTERSVSIDCSVKDKSTVGSGETQSNKILIHPKTGKQEVDILVTIGTEGISVSVPELDDQSANTVKISSNAKSGLPASAADFKELAKKLIPNPIVADLIGINRNDEDSLINEPKTPEDILNARLGRKNLWKVYRNVLRRNLIRGFSGAMVIFLIAITVFATIASKKINTDEVIEQRRLVIMQDLPENFNQGQNVDDPNKPPEPPKSEDGTGDSKNIIPNIIPKKINKPPRIYTVPKTEVKTDTNITSINKELDSLRKANITGKNNGKDTGIVNANLMPDSLLKPLNENEVGLFGRFPSNWKQMDSRQININQKEFTGVILVDTAVKKKEEALTMNIQLDLKSEYWNSFTFKNVFEEDSLRTIYSLDPKAEANQTYYRFYLSGKTDNVFVSAFVESTYFEKYKPEIERVVRSIRIQRQQKLSGQK